MRIFEILILFTCAILLVSSCYRDRISKRVLEIMMFFIILITVLHLTLEGYRWQMVPVYCFIGIGLLVTIRHHFVSPKSARSFWPKVIFCLSGSGMLLVAALLSTLLPVPSLPTLNGPYIVGTSTFHLVDTQRMEIYSDDPHDPRELMVQFWFPAKSFPNARTAPYIQQARIIAPAIAKRFDLPPFLLQHLDLINTNSLSDAPVLADQGPFPLLVFSHGLQGNRTQNTIMFEELASHGYVVASIDHTYDSVAVVFPDSRILYHDEDTVFPENALFLDSAQSLIRVRAADVIFLLDTLANPLVDSLEQVANGIDQNRIGIWGHSTGGGTALRVCAIDQRCGAYALLDGWIEPLSESTLESRVKAPALFINTAEWLSPENRILGETYKNHQTAPAYTIVIKEAGHNNFSDIPLLSPLTHQIGLTGSIDGRRGLEIMNAYLLDFFNKHLKYQEAPLLNGSLDAYPEAVFTSP